MKRILIIHTGGTFGMVPLKPSPTLAPEQVQKSITKHVPVLSQIADIEFISAFNLDSVNVTPKHWRILAEMIYKNLNDFDGFVIIHGTDSMSYTAAALSFMLQNLTKPVILTGSQRPLAEIRSDARMNLINAVELATWAIPEVCIFFETHLLRGNRAVKDSGVDYGAFISPNFPPLAEVGLEIELSDRILLTLEDTHFYPEISSEVLAIPFFPGFDSEKLSFLENTSVKAVVLQSLGMGNVATKENSLIPYVKKLIEMGKLVVITSQSRHGFVDLTRYESGRMLSDVGAIGAKDMTTEATIVKLMHLLGRFENDLKAVKKYLHIPLAGEITP